MKSPNYWSMAEIWNKSLENRVDRKTEKRSHLWASELGKSPIDIYLKLKGEPPSNPPNARSLRKFEAGNIWEWMVKLVLIRAGILIEEQKHVKHQYDGLLEVTGKVDFVAGGMPDFAKAKEEIDHLALPEVFARAFKDIMAYFETTYPKGLSTKVLELKSLSAFMFDSLERTGKASKIHRLQCYHYLKSMNLERGDVVYICRDDCRMMEVPVYLNSEVEQEYKAEIEKISGYIQRDEMPPLEKEILFDEDTAKFAKNFNIAYSMYLTKLYGYADQAEFDDKYVKIVGSWNRVISRIKAGKDLTKNNEEKLNEMREAGFDVEALIEKYQGTEKDLPEEEDLI